MGTRYDEATNANWPEHDQNPGDMLGLRHWGDGIAGRHSASRIQGFDTGSLAYYDVASDADGHLQVDVLSGGGAGTQYTEDAAAPADPVGGAQIMVRADTPATITSANGDNIGRRATNYGAAYTQLVTSTGSFIDSVGGGTEYTEDAAAAADPLGKATILVRRDTPGALVSADGDNVAQRGTNFGAAYTQIVSSTGSFIDTFGGGTEYTEDNAAAANPVGGQIMSRRRDTLNASEVTTDGDVIALNATRYGELYVQPAPAYNMATTGTLTGAAQVVGLSTPGCAAAVAEITGTWTATLLVQGSIDGSNWTDFNLVDLDNGGQIVSISANSTYLCSIGGFSQVRVLCNTYTSGTVNVALTASVGHAQYTWVEADPHGDGILKREDAAHASGNTGIMSLGVRNDAAAAFSGTDLDYTPLATDSAGRQYVGTGPSVEATGTIAANGDVIASTDVGKYRWVSVQLRGTWSATVNFEGSNDNTNWVPLLFQSPTDISSLNAVTATANGLWTAGTTTRYFRVRVSGYASGTVDVVVQYFFAPSSLAMNWPATRSEDTAHSTGQAGLFVLAVRNDAGAALAGTDLDYIPFTTDSSGALRVTGGGGGTQYTEDDAAPANPVGNAVALVRDDTPNTQVTTDGDIVAQRGTNYGAAYVQVVNSSGSFIDTFGGSGGTAMADDGAFTVGTTQFTPAGGTYRSVRDSVDDNDAGAFAMTQTRALYTTLETPAGDTVIDETDNAVRVSIVADALAGVEYTEDDPSVGNPSGPQIMGRRKDTLTGAQVSADDDVIALNASSAGAQYVELVSGTTKITGDASGLDVDTELPAAAALNADNVAAPTAPAVGSFGHYYDGTNWDRVRGDSTDGLLVNLGGNNDVIQATASNLNAQVVGSIAHDTADAGNPVKVGMKAIAHGTNPTGVTANDRTDWYANRAGIPFVIGGHPNIVAREYMATTAQTNDAIVTVSAGTKIVVTQAQAMVDNATTVDVGVRVGFGDTLPTEPTDGNTADGVFLRHAGIAPGSGVVVGSGAGIIGIGADGENVTITNEVATSGKLTVLVTYYTIES